jgi:glycosyltransferase involved in cell wall biosynthesis
MVSGLPVVLPRSGGMCDYAADDNAWLCKPTATAMAATVMQAMAQPDARRRRAVRAQALANALDWSRVIDRYFGAYDQIVAQSASTRPITAPRSRRLQTV